MKGNQGLSMRGECVWGVAVKSVFGAWETDEGR